ncbi:MAG: Mur ligase domain-containing protein, partial [Erysipelotrichaceae bacterium]
MKLSNIFMGAPAVEISTLSIDSRQPMTNGMFFCLEGLTTDGHQYIPQAIEQGAVCIVHSKELLEKPSNAIYVRVEDVADT